MKAGKASRDQAGEPAAVRIRNAPFDWTIAQRIPESIVLIASRKSTS